MRAQNGMEKGRYRIIRNIHKTCIFIITQKAFLLIIIKHLEKKPIL